MAETKKTIKQWEEERNILFLDTKLYPPNRQLTEQELVDILFNATEDDYRSVNHKDRIEFLKANGYEVTRENMIDPTLSAKQPDTEE